MLQKLPWPLPALLGWALAWTVWRMLLLLGWEGWAALGLGSAVGVGLSLLGQNWWRRCIIGLGFPLAVWLTGGVPAWGWLLPLLVLLLLYPVNAWRDAPLFPTPVGVLNDLPDVAPLEAGARVLDAGCGLGHGLEALRQAYPLAELHGIEWSRPLAWLCARRCPWARVQRGDIWQADWSGYDLIYLFQRPESMPRAVEKARVEMKPGAYLVSLEFEAEGLVPLTQLDSMAEKPVWVYRPV